MDLSIYRKAGSSRRHGPLNRWIAAAACWWLLVGATLAMAGAEFEEGPQDYVLQNWTVEDGLPQNSITKIVQAPDGYLWFASYNGLVRFDGVRFVVFDSGNTQALKANSVESLHLDTRGRMTVVTQGGDAVWFEAGRFSRCNGSRGLPESPLKFVGETPDGRLVFGDPQPGRQFREGLDGTFVTQLVAAEQTITADLDTGADGNGSGSWVKKNGEWSYTDRRSFLGFLPDTHGKSEAVRIIRPARQGGTWFVSDVAAFLRDGRTWKRSLPFDRRMGSCAAMLEDRVGNLWLGTWADGLWRITPEGRIHRYLVTHGREPEGIRSLFEDREGNLWMGTDGSGVFRLRRRLFNTIGAAQGLAGEVVKSVTEDRSGTVWVASQVGFEAIDFLPAPRPRPALRLGLGWSVFAASDGTVWLGDYQGDLYSHGSDKVRMEATNRDAGANPITAFFEEPGVALWVGTENGLWRVKGSHYSREPLGIEGLHSGVRAIALDHGGRLWVGFNGDGLIRREGDVWRRIQSYGGPPDGRVLSLMIDREDTVWAGSAGSGLYRLEEGHFFRFDPTQTGLPRVVSSVMEDRAGFVWLGSTEGIFRVNRQALNQFADGQAAELAPTRYTRSDGLGTSECAMNVQPAAWRSGDGRLWFATRQGVSVVDPKTIAVSAPPPPTLIEEVLLWGASNPKRPPSLPRQPEARGPIRVAPDVRRIEIHYTAPNFSAPDRVRFRYRLEGPDAAWTLAGTRRVAYYEGLGPGTYRFRVAASGGDNAWDTTGAELVFMVVPHYWQTWWFRGLALAAFAGLVFRFYNIRVRQLHAVNRLRLRMAGDLHDEIGANVGSIGLNVQMLQRRVPLEESVREDLAGLHRLAAQTSQSIRDLVWLTNPDFDNCGEMVQRMRESVTLQLAGRERSLKAENMKLDRRLSPDFRRHVFSIFKEAVHNIAKHAGASRIEVILSEKDNWLEMVIADNGCGFPEGTPEGHGLGSMRRRALELGGELKVVSADGEGTRLTLSAPFEHPRSGWRGLWRRSTRTRYYEN
ncbi:MAG TPA: two-component regulator propeller domain-containing protein [Candidatus Limnocylindria bacterium]|nr:two-component regulator propeller domain-containing protein [Candidatus Limnocylindria bacterium]